MSQTTIRIRGLAGIPEILPGDDLCRRILDALGPVDPGAVLVVAQKVVSKAENRIVALETVTASPKAKAWADKHQKDPRIVELVLREARRIVRMERGIIIAETHHGFVCANAGVDSSNAPLGKAVLLPRDPDDSARRLHAGLQAALRIPVGVIISDTFGRPWRLGLTNIALGVAGISPVVDYRGQPDSYGRRLQATVLAVADELASAAELVMGKTLGIPAAVIEGYPYTVAEGSGRSLVRPQKEDLFR
jgi:coenzyme F420-0:L-glutamate ligase/coenzyme F420-1:gamma-L-glutamate ligase